MKKLDKTIRKFVKTPDEWFPCYTRHRVQVSLHQDSKTVYRVALWGNDDFGLEKAFNSKVEALNCYDTLPNPITIQYLKKTGFVIA